MDDFLWAGSDMFKKNVIHHIRSKFHCGKEMDNKFRYIGLDIEHYDKQIYLQQHDYVITTS